MLAFITRRIVQSIPVFFLVSVAVFLVVRLVPGDPAEVAAGENATQQRVEEIRIELGIDRPLAQQYVSWLASAVQGDLGMSFERGLPVSRLLKLALPPTIEITLLAYPVALLLGIPLGALAGRYPGSRVDFLASLFSIMSIAVPSFVVASLLLWIFSIELGWFPASGRVSVLGDPLNGIRAAALPVAALGLGMSGSLVRYTRTAVAQVYQQDYVRTARAKGLHDRTILWRHAMRNALIPIVTVAALQLGQLLSGAVIIEQVFTRPGLGRLMVSAVQTRDYAVVQGGLLVLVAVFLVVNLLADISYGLIDPRIRVR